MASNEPVARRPIKELPRAFGAKRINQSNGQPYAHSKPHSRNPSRDTGSRTTEGDSASYPTTSDPESTNSTSAPSTPPQVAADALPSVQAKGDDAATNADPGSTTFRFTNLPRIARSDLLMDPLAAARVVLNYSTRAQQALSMQANKLTDSTADLQTQTSNLIGGMASLTALYSNTVRSQNLAEQSVAAPAPLGTSTAPDQAQNAFSVARMQAQQDDDECGPELTVYEHSVNKKKRKSGRVTYMDSSGAADGYRVNSGKGDCSWYCGDDADYPPEDDSHRDYTVSAPEDPAQELEAPPPLPRMVFPPPHIPLSTRHLLRTKRKVTAKSRFSRFQRREKANAAALEASQAHVQGNVNGDSGKDGKTEAAAEKKSVRRATKAESRAKVRGGGAQKISLAALKAKLAEEQHNANGGDSSVGGGKSTAKSSGSKVSEKSGRPASPAVAAEVAPAATAPSPPKEAIKPPTGTFTFSRPSPIASRLIAMRAEVEMLQSKLSDSLRPIDEAVAAAADVLTRMDAGEDVAHAHAEAAAALNIARTNLEAIPSPAAALNGGAYGTARAAPSRQPAPVPSFPLATVSLLSETTHATTPAITTATAFAPASASAPAPLPPLATAPTQPLPSAPVAPAPAPNPPAASTPPPNVPKMSRRKKANMNNIHHRANYVPSRMPSDPPASARGPSKNVTPVQNWEQPPGLDHPTTTCSLFANEWLCLFCEYELLYGELPSMVRACRRRKKIVGARKRAQDRAHRAAGGEVADDDTEAGSQAADKKKKKGKKKGRQSEHSHECCTCTCGKENPAEWEPDAPFHNANHEAPPAPQPYIETVDGQGYDPADHDPDNCETCQANIAESAAAANQYAAGPASATAST